MRRKINVEDNKAKNTIRIINTHRYKQARGVSFSLSGVKWMLHNCDDDKIWPSCPHMHAIEKPWKLDLYTGRFYDINTKK